MAKTKKTKAGFVTTDKNVPRVKKTLLRRSDDTMLRKNADLTPNKVVENTGSVLQMKKSITAKKFSQEAYERAKALMENEELTQAQAAEKMSADGWTSPSGGTLTQPILARFMRDRGYRIHEHSKKKNVVPETATGPERDIIKLLQTDLDLEAKMSAILGIAQNSLSKKGRRNYDI